MAQGGSSARTLIEPWMTGHKSLVYRIQILLMFWQPIGPFIALIVGVNFSLLWIGSWLTSWSILTGAALYGLGWLALATFPLTMPVYDSNAPVADTDNPEKPEGHARGLMTIPELVDAAERGWQLFISCLSLLRAFHRAHPRRFFAEAGVLLVLIAVLGTKMSTPRLFCLILNICILYPGLQRRGLIAVMLAKVPTDKRLQVHQLAEKALALSTPYLHVKPSLTDPVSTATKETEN